MSMTRSPTCPVMVAALCFFFSVGCDRVPAEPENVTLRVDSISNRTSPTAVASSIAGYVHSRGCSKFRLGDNVFAEVQTSQFERWHGSLGAFATDLSNGHSSAMIDAVTVPATYELDDSTHNFMVQSYFVGCGLPSDQIDHVDTNYQFSVDLDGSGSTPVPRKLSLNSVLHRSVQGVPVADSFAWAKMSTSGEVDAEDVFWPPLDSNVVASAVALKASLSDPTSNAAFLANLPSSVTRVIGVVIHHSNGSVHSGATSYVAVDALLSDVAGEHHFNAGGQEFRLPHEVQNLASTPRP